MSTPWGVTRMAWENSDRKDRLPPDWERRRRYVLRRDQGVCQWHKTSGLCGQPANQVDHIEPGDDHSASNLQALCEWHHGKKSGGEGGRASAALKRANALRFRRTEGHPGLL